MVSVMFCPLDTVVIGVNTRMGETDAPVMVVARAMERKVICPKIAGKVPEVDASRMRAPSLVVPEATVVIAACAAAGRENCAKFNAT
jgi:hypothetical protein